MPTINVNGAAARLLATGPLAKAGLCLHYCWLAISQGKVHYITGGADTAYNTWLAVPADEQHSSRSVPKDFPAFLGKKFLSAAGDVIISNGDGTFVATDWPKSKQVGICTLEQREKQTGRKFVGWASSMGGYELESTNTAGLNLTAITNPLGDTDMQYWKYGVNGRIVALDNVHMEYRYLDANECMALDNLVKAGLTQVATFNDPAWSDTLAGWKAIEAPRADVPVVSGGPTAEQIATELVKLIPKVPTKFTGSLS